MTAAPTTSVPGRAQRAPRAPSLLGLARRRAVLRSSPSLFLIVPTLYLVVGSFQDPTTAQFTLAELRRARPSRTSPTRTATSIEISLVTAIVGGALRLPPRLAVIRGGLPRFLRSALMTFSGVASNFAGVPLAFAFIFTLGRVGLVTPLLNDGRLRPLRHGFNIYSKFGARARLPLFPDPADGPDHRAGDRRPEEGMARGGGEHGRERLAVLALRRAADPAAVPARHA